MTECMLIGEKENFDIDNVIELPPSCTASNKGVAYIILNKGFINSLDPRLSKLFILHKVGHVELNRMSDPKYREARFSGTLYRNMDHEIEADKYAFDRISTEDRDEYLDVYDSGLKTIPDEVTNAYRAALVRHNYLSEEHIRLRIKSDGPSDWRIQADKEHIERMYALRK